MTRTAGSRQEVRTGLLVGGEVEGAEDWFPVLDPAAPLEVVGHAAAAAPEQTRQAVDAADAAWPAWSARAPEQRAELLLEALRNLGEDHDARADLLVREDGKPLAEARDELAVLARRCTLAAATAGELRPVRHLLPQPRQEEAAPERFRSEVAAVPLGVVTIVLPASWPLAVLAASLPYALVAGDTVVVKPPSSCPLTVVDTLRLLAERLPAGVLNAVTGSGPALSPLLRDPRVQRIVFTGSTATGRRVVRAAADNVTRVTLGLSGNNPAIVLDDADLDPAAVARLAAGAFLSAGQVGAGVKRVHVHRSRYHDLVEGLSTLLEHHRIGHGLHPGTTMGPLNSARRRDRVTDLVDRARAAGCEVREFGTLGEETRDSGGHFLRPALVLDPPPDESIVVEEQFGPALPILPYDDLDRVVDAVNRDWSGLGASVWSADPDRAEETARRLRVGTVRINDAHPVAGDDRAPSGGFRQSGTGRVMGFEGLMEMTETRTVTRPR